MVTVIPYIMLAILGSTVGIVSDNLQTVSQQMNKWHTDCDALTMKAKGKGHFFRQCMKDHRTQARKEHAMNLRASLSEELKDLQLRKAAAASTSESDKQRNDKPHILLITTDQQRQDSLGCYHKEVEGLSKQSNGQFKAKTPYIDQLARDGMLVEDAWAASPVCSPSRTSILLGVHVPVHGVIENGLGFFSESRLTPFVGHLSQSGYRTALIGKSGFSPMPYDQFTHLNILGEGGEDREFGTNQYDYLETYLVNCSMQWILEQDRLGQGDTVPWFLHLSLMSPHPPNTIPTEWEHRYYGNSGDSQDSQDVTEEDRGRGEEGVRLTPPLPDFMVGDFSALPLQTKFLQGMLDIPPNRDALRALGLSNLNNDSLSLKVAAQNQGAELPSHKWFTASRAFPLELKGKPDLGNIHKSRLNYYNQVAFVDDQIGRLMYMLDKELEYKERLLVIFTSDHGALLHDHGVPDKHTLIGEAPRVPLILRWPTVIEPHSRTEIASLLDVTATILTAAQIKHEVWREVSGMDLIGSHVSITSTEESQVHAQAHIGNKGDKKKIRSAVAVTDFFGYGVITAQWKLLYYPQHNETYLFHRKTDPHDRINRYDEVKFNPAHFGPYVMKQGEDAMSDSEVGGVMLYSLLRWRSRQIPPKLKPEDTQVIARRRIRPYNTVGVKDSPDGMDAEYGLMHDLRHL